MNTTRWAFLYHGVQRSEKQQMEIAQLTLARALGLHVVPVQDEQGRLRMPQRFDEMTSLLPAIARKEYLAGVLQKIDDLQRQDTAAVSGDLPDSPPQGLMADETGLEILDKPIDFRKLSVAEQRHAMAAMGIHEKPTELPPELQEDPKAHYREPALVPKPKLRLDE